MSSVPAGSIRQPIDVPPDRLVSIIGRWPEPALLESGPGFGDAGRWSILTARPRAVFEAVGDQVSLSFRLQDGTATGERVETRHPFEALADLLDRFGLSHQGSREDARIEPDRPPFLGGLVGYFGYDLAPFIERLPRRAPRDSRLPDIRLGLYDTAVLVDHSSQEVALWAHDLLGEGDAATRARAQRWRRDLQGSVVARLRASRVGRLESNFRREDYLAAVERVLEYIAAGDIFQANLSQRFEARGEIEPLDLYRRLCKRSPAPFAAYLRWEARDGEPRAVVSASPEWFYQTRGDRIVTRPIKGTRPRGDTDTADQLLADELARSPKDRAELTMIVDLERNDLGRVCRFGTIRVTDALKVESFAQVHHLVATVEGRLRPEVGHAEVLRALFPGGSITGAPKIRAMQIIDELEPTRRSLYTGAIGYLSRSGSSAFNIAIRTMVVEGARVSYQVGGGIVADSDPLTEYHETLHKGRGMRDVLRGPGG